VQDGAYFASSFVAIVTWLGSYARLGGQTIGEFTDSARALRSAKVDTYITYAPTDV